MTPNEHRATVRIKQKKFDLAISDFTAYREGLVAHADSAILSKRLVILRTDLPSPGFAETRTFIARIASMGFEWGVSDGN